MYLSVFIAFLYIFSAGLHNLKVWAEIEKNTKVQGPKLQTKKVGQNSSASEVWMQRNGGSSKDETERWQQQG